MSARAFIEQLGSVGPHRMQRLVDAGTISSFFVLVGPDRAAGNANRSTWNAYDGLPMLAWYVCGSDQERDVANISAIDAELEPLGWVLDIEKALEGQKLSALLDGVAGLGRPIVASLGGAQTASHIELDYRTLDRYGVQCDWQAYFDSGEGAPPATCVQELYQSSFVLPGWEYRHRLGSVYGWGRVTRIESYLVARYDSYRRPGKDDGYISVSPREWGYSVVARELMRDGVMVGLFMGRTAYPLIAVTLDVTRTAQARKTSEWTPIAASARAPGAARRPVSIYLLDTASDEVVAAIAAGAP